MAAGSLRSLQKAYLFLTDGTLPSVEWAWLVGRIGVTLITLAIGVRSLDGYAGATAIITGAVVVVLYSGFLAYLLRVGRYRAIFAIGFFLDNLVVIFTWWFTASHYRPSETDDSPATDVSALLAKQNYKPLNTEHIGLADDIEDDDGADADDEEEFDLSVLLDVANQLNSAQDESAEDDDDLASA
jgi:hypothetical protein